MKITRTSPISRLTRTLEIPVTNEQLEAWHEGALIQNAMPNLTADEREFIMTGITSEEWDAMFNQSEELE